MLKTKIEVEAMVLRPRPRPRSQFWLWDHYGFEDLTSFVFIYKLSSAIWDPIMLPASRQKWTRPASTPARQAGARFTYPGGMEGWVDLSGLLYSPPKWFTCPQTVPPTTSRSELRKSDVLTVALPNHNSYRCCPFTLHAVKCWNSLIHACMHVHSTLTAAII